MLIDLYAKLKKCKITGSHELKDIVKACGINPHSVEFEILKRSWPNDRNNFDNFGFENEQLMIPEQDECPICNEKKGTYICPKCLENHYREQKRHGQYQQDDDDDDDDDDDQFKKIKEKYSDNNLFFSNDELSSSVTFENLPEDTTIKDVKKVLKNINFYMPKA